MEAAVIGYATPKDWQDAMRNNSRYKMHEIIERLGLKANWSSNKRGKTNFDSPLVKQLVADMGDVVAGLPKEHHELHAHLSAPGSLRTEVEDLLKKHGSEIWGRTGPREHLVKAGSADVEPLFYPKDLYFENEEDRSLIRVLLHWWLGQKAFNVILARDRMARERKRKEMFRKARANGQGPHDTASPLDVSQIPGILSNEPPRHAQILQLDTGVGSRPMSAASLTPPASSESPIVQPRPSISASTNGFTAINAKIHRQEDAFARPVSVPRQSTSRQVAAELENLVSNFLWDMGTAAKGHEYRTASPATPQFAPGEASRNGTAHRGLDIDTLRAFRRYIYPNQDGPECEEELLLRRLETAWRDTVRSCHKANYGNTTLFAARDRAFLTWIELKRHLAELERVDKCWREAPSSARETETRIKHHIALMSGSREIIRSWESIGQGVDVLWAPRLSADDLLVQAFVLLAGETNTPDMLWAPVNVADIIRWLSENLRHFDEDEEFGERRDQLFYVR